MENNCKMIKGVGSKFDDYSISPKIRQILLHWGYKSTEKYFFINSTNYCIKMSNSIEKKINEFCFY